MEKLNEITTNLNESVEQLVEKIKFETTKDIFFKDLELFCFEDKETERSLQSKYRRLFPKDKKEKEKRTNQEDFLKKYVFSTKNDMTYDGNKDTKITEEDFFGENHSNFKMRLFKIILDKRIEVTYPIVNIKEALTTKEPINKYLDKMAKKQKDNGIIQEIAKQNPTGLFYQ